MGNPIATNKKAYHDYFFTEKWECGIVLSGGEVKSIRAVNVNFKDSYARMKDDEILLYNLHIPPYREASYLNPDPDRARKLLLHKKEIRKIIGSLQQKHLTLIPTKIYLSNRGFVKVELALGKGKKSFDKRDSIKKRDIERSMKRTMHTKRR